MTTWTMYYGPHVVQRGLGATRVQQLADEWETCLASGHTWFKVGVMVPGTFDHAEVILRAANEAQVAFVPDIK